MQFEVRDRRGRGWFWVENEILDRFAVEMGPYGLAVYIALSRHTDNETQRCFPSQGRIAELTGMGRKKVNEEIQHLEELGLIGVEELKGNRLIYYLLRLPEG